MTVIMPADQTKDATKSDQEDDQIVAYLRQLENEEAEEEDQQQPPEEEPFSYFDLVSIERILPLPIKLEVEHLKEIIYKLGLIKLCWPEIVDPEFEGRTNFPNSYLQNSDKEKVLLLHAENFRLQYCHQHRNRKPLFLASENELGIQVCL